MTDAFYSDRLRFEPLVPENREALAAALAACASANPAPELADATRTIVDRVVTSDDSIWALQRMQETVGGVVARLDRDAQPKAAWPTLVVSVFVVPRWRGVAFAGEAIGTLATRAFGYDDVGPSASCLRMAFSPANQRAERVAMRIGCTVVDEGAHRIARLTPVGWLALERKPGWPEGRVARLMESVLPGALERLTKRIEGQIARDRANYVPPPPAPRGPSGDPVLDALVANPPTRMATSAEVDAAQAECNFGGNLEALQRCFRAAYFSDDELASLAPLLRRGVNAALELRSAEEATDWIRRYIWHRAPPR